MSPPRHTQQDMVKGEPKFPDPLPGAPTCGAKGSLDYQPATGWYRVGMSCDRRCIMNRTGALPASEEGILPQQERPANMEECQELFVPQITQLVIGAGRRCIEEQSRLN